jgi:DNA-binding CsgD family transcriptional regulator
VTEETLDALGSSDQCAQTAAAALTRLQIRREHMSEQPSPGLSRRLARFSFGRGLSRVRERSPRHNGLELWHALVAGRWSLLDRFESDGRRYLVARRNDDDVRDPRGLTSRERQIAARAALGHSNKLIAYELGVSPSTVATFLTRALKKLGCATRAELRSALPV